MARPGRLGVWTETGILDRFPDKGLAGAVADADPRRLRRPGGRRRPRVRHRLSQTARVLRGTERMLSLDESTGRVLWTREWEANYGGMLDTWAIGPAATPTVDGDRVYVLGRAGTLSCLNAETGDVVWQKDYVKDYGAEMPTWGFTGAPLVDGNRLICLVGGAPNAKVVAFDKMTGKEIWRALPSNSEPGYAQPIIINAGGTRQLIIWHPVAVSSLDPATGSVYWEQPFKIDYGMTVPTAVQSGSRLLVSCFYNGSLMLSLDDENAGGPRALEGQERQRNPDRRPARGGRHAGHRRRLHLRHLQLRPVALPQCEDRRARLGDAGGDREKARWASGQIVRHGDRYFINNDRGDLIIARTDARRATRRSVAPR